MKKSVDKSDHRVYITQALEREPRSFEKELKKDLKKSKKVLDKSKPLSYNK